MQQKYAKICSKNMQKYAANYISPYFAYTTSTYIRTPHFANGHGRRRLGPSARGRGERTQSR